MCPGLPCPGSPLHSQVSDLWNSENTRDRPSFCLSRGQTHSTLPRSWEKPPRPSPQLSAPTLCLGKGLGSPLASHRPAYWHTLTLSHPRPQLSGGGGIESVFWGGGSQGATQLPHALGTCIPGSGRAWRRGKAHRYLPGTRDKY